MDDGRGGGSGRWILRDYEALVFGRMEGKRVSVCQRSESESCTVMSDSLCDPIQSMEFSRPEYWSG